MTLASRLSTQVNLALIHDKKTYRQAILGNMALIQLQSIVVGLLASFLACIDELLREGSFAADNLLILIASSIGTASIASLILGSFMMFVIFVSHKYKINPDNVATPVAASNFLFFCIKIFKY
jgi:solute carrier family 41